MLAKSRALGHAISSVAKHINTTTPTTTTTILLLVLLLLLPPIIIIIINIIIIGHLILSRLSVNPAGT